ncbi:MAG: nucleoside 2-deoxyribosyltransferase, partial [Candidatus Limnocylindrus sp.]
MKIYLAGPLFNEGERGQLSGIAARLRAAGVEVFVPHEQFVELEGLNAAGVYATDLAGIRSANLVLAWLDGTQVDDGTAVEIGIFTQLCAVDPSRYKGIVGL